MTATTLERGARKDGASAPPFPAQHPWDRNFFLGLVALIWTGILMGFVPQMVRHVASHQQPYPLIVHLHAAAFVGWTVLLTAQVLLVRSRRLALHRRLGYSMVGLGALMLVLGPAAAWVVQRRDFGGPHSNPAFLSVQFIAMVTFAVVGGAGVLLRNSPSAHKRLMIIATLVLADAGFARWLGAPIAAAFGKGPWQRYLGLSGATAAIIVAIGVYDLITRRRLQPAYAAGAAWALAGQGLAAYLLFLPAWKAFTTHLLSL
jgi:FtsH-binding integral membrane protein